MILDTLGSADAYKTVHAAFEKGFEFLRRSDLADLEPGKYEVDEEVYVIVLKEQGRKKEDAQIETHRDWIDIQYVIAGNDMMGWKPAGALSEPVADYDGKKDLQFFHDKPDSWVMVGPGQFVVFFPSDAHLPMISDGMLHKAVVKIRA